MSDIHSQPNLPSSHPMEDLQQPITSEDSIASSEQETQPPPSPAQPGSYAGLMLVAYANENDNKTIKYIQVDMEPLARMAEREGFTREEFLQRTQGFSDALDLICKNYNIAPKETPWSQEEWEQLQHKFFTHLREQYNLTKQTAEQPDTTTAPSS